LPVRRKNLTAGPNESLHLRLVVDGLGRSERT